MQAILKWRISTISFKQMRTISLEASSLKSWTDIPGPSPLPIIGAMHHFMPGGKLHNLNGKDLFENLYNTYGPIVKLEFLGARPNIFLYDAESTSQILRGERQTPKRTVFESLEYYRKSYKKDRDSNSHIGLITNDIDQWQKLRSTVNPVFLQPKIMKLYNNVLDEVAMDMIKRLKSLRDDKNMIKGKIEKELNLFALESMGVIALGCRLNCFDQNLSEDSPVNQLIEVVEEIFRTVNELDFKPSMWKLYATPTFKKAMKYFELQESVAKHFINKAIKEFESKQKPDEEKGILEKLLDINKDVAYTIATDALLAGVDTASNTILGALYLLAINPEKQDKLREELNTNSEQQPYLKACIKEAMRLMPVGIGNFRQTTKEYNILGYKIPANVGVTFAHQIMCTMDQYYVRPKEYVPERWLVGKDHPLHHKNAHPFTFVPFGFGTRSCLGRRIAELEIEIFLNRAIKNFEVGWFGPPPRVVQRVINYVEGPLNFTFKDAR